MNQPPSSEPSGLPHAIGAYLLWGLLPLYLIFVHDVPAFEFVGWRVVWTVPVCLVIVTARRQWPEVKRTLGNVRLLGMLALSAVLIGSNWLIYIVAIQAGHVFAASLGYYINPLVNVLAGTLFLGERLSRRQWLAVALAVTGMTAETYDQTRPRRTHLAYVMNADSGTVSVVDPAALKVTRTIAVKPALELPAKVGPDLLAINDEDEGELELVDLAKGKALAPIRLAGCEGPTGLAFDPADHLTLSACANGVAALVDVKTRKVVKLLPIGAGPDGALFDSKRHRFIVPCGRSGTLSVFSVDRGATVIPLATVRTEIGARTAALDEAGGRIFMPSAQFKPAEAGKFPQAVPGTAHLLIFTPV